MTDVPPSPATGEPPALAAPTRPRRPLGPLAFLRAAGSNPVAMFDEALFDELVTVRRYGPVTVAFVSDPVGVRHVLADRFADYPRIPAVRRLFAAEIGTGTLAVSGPVWRRHRAISAPAMDRRAIAPDAADLVTAAEAHAERLRPNVGEAVNIEAFTAGLGADLLARMSSGGDPRVPPILAWLAKAPRKPRALDLLPMPAWLKERVSAARSLPDRTAGYAAIQAMLEERRAPAYAGPRDLLWRLAHGVDRQTGEGLPPDELRDEAASLLMGGLATVRALTWIWYLLALHPEVEARLHAELDAVLSDAPLTPEHLRRLPYTRRVLDEVMRLYPPIPVVPRYAAKADVICGKKVPRGAIVLVAPYVLHRHRRLWDAPERFDPDRFTEARSRDRPRFAFIPFIVGPGVCTGMHFAELEMLAVTAAMARRYRFALKPGVEVTPTVGGITLHPRGGLWVIPTPRPAPADAPLVVGVDAP